VCSAGLCLHQGLSRTGCTDQVCAPCGNACPAVYQPVCGQVQHITKTFGNACEAANANATVLHSGECLTGEGAGCGPPTGLGLGTCDKGGTLYCRDACPACDDGMFTCIKVGACVTAFDCPAGGAPPPCPFGTQPSYQCVSNACVATCQ
jgi:hypothetical protein